MYQGHSQAHHGLQNHSVGANYPFIVVSLGDGSHQVEWEGAVIVKESTIQEAFEWARFYASVYRSKGWEGTRHYLNLTSKV